MANTIESKIDLLNQSNLSSESLRVATRAVKLCKKITINSGVIERIINAKKNDVFRILAQGQGRGKPHESKVLASGLREYKIGEIKD